MGLKDKDASERRFQERYVRELEKYRWTAPEHLDGNRHKVTVEDLIKNWRKELNRINADQLENVPLTDNEFKQVMAKVNSIANSYEAAKLLAMENGKGKIDGIYRDAQPGVTRSQVTLTIFSKASVRGGYSSYTIAREVWHDENYRFDLVLLINGLPLINIELKRADKSLDEAFGQFKRYYREGAYTYNFMAFSQMMVMSTEVATKYMATPKSLDDFNPSFTFHWSNKQNHIINDYVGVIKHFLMIPMAHQMVGDYLVIDEARHIEDRRIMLMRPYQVYALQAVEGAAFGRDGKDGIPHGGYVWHTTGSGKTITSFKTALFLSTRVGFDKVVFLLDRRDLDRKTAEDFAAYAEYEAVSVDSTRSTYELGRKLKDSGSKIVVSTTFKLHSLVKELQEQQDESLKDKKMVFIVDEAHRTTMGEMMGSIMDFFKKNSLFFGFTGTPLFDENKVKGMVAGTQAINTTEKLFGPKLHQYTIDEAIKDGNVLGFHVDYINTGEFKSYEDLREKLVLLLQEESPDQSQRDIERRVALWSDLEVEQESKKRGILKYQDPTHIPRVVTEIIDNWESQSQERQFNGMLTVAYKSRVIAYYHEFKKQLQERGKTLNVAMTFSFGEENDPDTVLPDITAEMFADYEAFTDVRFKPGDKQNGEDAYFSDLMARVKRGGSGRNPKNVDLVIVADQLLTGYDAKRLNTLYVDRTLELQGLIQAYSRTNRVFGASKEFGTIVNFQFPKITEKQVDEALILYGTGGTSSDVIVDTYEVAVAKFKQAMIEMKETLANPTEWHDLVGNEEAKGKFKSAYIKAASQLNRVMQYYEFSWDDAAFHCTEHLWLQYQGAYKNLFSRDIDPDEEIILPLEGPTKIVGTKRITAEYILDLLGGKVAIQDGTQVVDEETLRLIYEEIQDLSNQGEAQKAELLREFVKTELELGKVAEGISIPDAYDAWKQSKLDAEIAEFAQLKGLDSVLLKKSYERFDMKHPLAIPLIDELTDTAQCEGDALDYALGLEQDIPEWMKKIKLKYS